MGDAGAFEAEKTLGALLDLVQQGEEVVITRDGTPMARLASETGGSDARERARAAAEKVAQLSRSVTPGEASNKELIDEGRP